MLEALSPVNLELAKGVAAQENPFFHEISSSLSLEKSVLVTTLVC